MTNHLEHKKQQVRYWSKIASLTLTLLPPLLRWQKGQNPFVKDLGRNWKESSLRAKCLTIGICLILLIISYYLNYYAISSVFWPESLSLINWILLIPCSVSVFLEVKDSMKLLTK